MRGHYEYNNSSKPAMIVMVKRKVGVGVSEPVAEWSDDNDSGVGAPDGDPQKDIGDGHLGNLQLSALFTAATDRVTNTYEFFLLN